MNPDFMIKPEDTIDGDTLDDIAATVIGTLVIELDGHAVGRDIAAAIVRSVARAYRVRRAEYDV